MMIRWPRLRRLASVAAGPLLIYGCATHAVEFPEVRSLRDAFPRDMVPSLGGEIASRPGRQGLIVAAPHGNSDARTAEIAREIARRTGFGLVVATGFQLTLGRPEGSGARFQVNRPYEGTPGRPPTEDVPSEDARRVYEAYERRVREAAHGPLRFYCEIHGNAHADTAGHIEIATVGISKEFALRLRTLVELIRDAHLRVQQQAPSLAVLVEPADVLRYTASGAKRDGILRVPQRALHIELPRAARFEYQEVYTAILADFIAQAVTLPEGR